jgi:hypothetical protein
MNTSYDFEYQLRRSIRTRKVRAKTIWASLIILSAYLLFRVIDNGVPYIATLFGQLV